MNTSGSHRRGDLWMSSPRQTLLIVAAVAAGLGCLVWMATDMGHPLVQLTMPGTPDWEWSIGADACSTI